LHDFKDSAGEPLPVFFLNLELFAAGASQFDPFRRLIVAKSL
jgi:hypothetical protein